MSRSDWTSVFVGPGFVLSFEKHCLDEKLLRVTLLTFFIVKNKPERTIFV